MTELKGWRDSPHHSQIMQEKERGEAEDTIVTCEVPSNRTVSAPWKSQKKKTKQNRGREILVREIMTRLESRVEVG